MQVKDIARICHEANRAYCETLGDLSQHSWEYADQAQKDSMIRGVEFRLANYIAGADAQHNAWMANKTKEGWRFGLVKDAVKKEHPCLVPYDQLPPQQRRKDLLFMAIVQALMRDDEEIQTREEAIKGLRGRF